MDLVYLPAMIEHFPLIGGTLMDETNRYITLYKQSQTALDLAIFPSYLLIIEKNPYF
jgi:hypothetical protein